MMYHMHIDAANAPTSITELIGVNSGKSQERRRTTTLQTNLAQAVKIKQRPPVVKKSTLYGALPEGIDSNKALQVTKIMVKSTRNYDDFFIPPKDKERVKSRLVDENNLKSEKDDGKESPEIEIIVGTRDFDAFHGESTK